MTTADPWALAASALPIAFSQVREDPRLDLEIARSLPPGATTMMIASGGETAVCLARLPLARLILVDMNPAQLALTRCRFHLGEHYSPSVSMGLLGHTEMPSEKRWETWASIFRKLGLAENVLGSSEIIGRLGPDHCGRYEAAFAELRCLLAPASAEIMKFLNSLEPTSTPPAIDHAFASALRLENLVALFGEGATQNPRRLFHEHFPAQLREMSARKPPAENPWIWQLLAGKFPPSAPYDWLLDQVPPAVQPEYICSSMLAAMSAVPAGSVDFLHLSNILDWLSPSEACETLTASCRALRLGGRLIIRQLNSSLDIPSLFPGLAWDAEHGRHLQLADRSFFYAEIHLATRP